jgi:hypothetical protein
MIKYVIYCYRGQKYQERPETTIVVRSVASPVDFKEAKTSASPKRKEDEVDGSH